MRIAAVAGFSLGMLVAGSEGPMFPVVNLIGAAVMIISAMVMHKVQP